MKNDKLNLCLRIKLNAPPLENFDAETAVKRWLKLKKKMRVI